MMWKKAVLVATVVIAVTIGILSVKPAQVQVTEFTENAHVRTSESMEIPFTKKFSITGFGVSGSWEGPGFAQVWLFSGKRQYLVMDTRVLPKMIELSAFGTSFDASCIDSCSLSPLEPTKLFIIVSGPGMLSIDHYHFVVPMEPTGLAIGKVKQSDTPDHSLLLVVLLLAVSVFGAHLCSHWCKSSIAKKALIGVFLGGFLILGGMFGVTVAAPTAAFAVTAKKAASVFAALAILILFIMMALELLISNKDSGQSKPDVWKDLEEAEEQLERK